MFVCFAADDEPALDAVRTRCGRGLRAARGFAAVALGIVCDKQDLPWNTPIAKNTNYRANVSTLTNGVGTGILDIL